MGGKTDPEKTNIPVNTASSAGEDASTQIAGSGNTCQPSRSSPSRIIICNIPDSRFPGGRASAVKTDESAFASVAGVKENVNVVYVQVTL